jgi:hypothetical protein
MLVLIEKLAGIHAGLFEYELILSQKDLINFIKIEFGRIGADTNITPREVIRDFIELINIIYQNPNRSISDILGDNSFELAKGGLTDEEIHGEFAKFEV